MLEGLARSLVFPLVVLADPPVVLWGAYTGSAVSGWIRLASSPWLIG